MAEFVEYTVIKKPLNGRSEDHGPHRYRVSPRAGGHIDLSAADGIAHVYEVKAISHPEQPTTYARDFDTAYIE